MAFPVSTRWRRGVAGMPATSLDGSYHSACLRRRRLELLPSLHGGVAGVATACAARAAGHAGFISPWMSRCCAIAYSALLLPYAPASYFWISEALARRRVKGLQMSRAIAAERAWWSSSSTAAGSVWWSGGVMVARAVAV